MAINNARMQQLRGVYGDFNKSKALPGEFQVVIANDPSAPSGKAVYMAFAAGDVRRLVSIEDIEAMVAAGQFKGDKGDTGNGIDRITFVKTDNTTRTSTYKIWFTDGNSYEYEVQNGKSAYTYAVEAGYSGTEQKFYSDLSVFSDIVASEQVRITAENARASAENLRIEAEKSRKTAEISRADAESVRASDETSRSNAENIRKSAEELRLLAESSRVSAELVRAEEELSRKSSENTRTSSEEARETNESARINAESVRVTSESARMSAELARKQAFNAKIEEIDVESTEIIQRANTAVEQVNDARADAVAAVGNANSAAAEIIRRANSGEFDGKEGKPGMPGTNGMNGITTQVNGLFTLSGDADGNLYAYFTDATHPPQFEVDENNNIYQIIPDE